MAILIATRGPKQGQCNVCGEHGPLTEDHTPPKGCMRPTQVELVHLSQLLSDDPTKLKGRYSQNGVKYRTLCGRCNNTLLGANYDPAFISFVNAVGGLLKSSLHLPPVISVRGQPQAILRALIGHLSAQGVSRYLKGPLTETVRDYFLDTSMPLPDGLRVFYWAYPHRPHVMFRDAAYLDIPSGHSFLIWVLKFFPISFLVAWGEPMGLAYPIHSFEQWRAVPYSTEADIPVSLRPIPPILYWPETPTNQSILLYGQEAIYARG